MHAEFEVHMLSEQGKVKARSIAQAFDDCLNALLPLCPPGRELAIVRTKLEEACFFAKKAMANGERVADEGPAAEASGPPRGERLLRVSTPPAFVRLRGKGRCGEIRNIASGALLTFFHAKEFTTDCGDVAEVLSVQVRDNKGVVSVQHKLDSDSALELPSLFPGWAIEVNVRFLKDGEWTGTFTGATRSCS